MVLIVSFVMSATRDFGRVHTRAAAGLLSVCYWCTQASTWWSGSTESKTYHCEKGISIVDLDLKMMSVEIVFLMHLNICLSQIVGCHLYPCCSHILIALMLAYLWCSILRLQVTQRQTGLGFQNQQMMTCQVS